MFIFVIFTGRAELVQPLYAIAASMDGPGIYSDFSLAVGSSRPSVLTGNGCELYPCRFSKALGVVGLITDALGSLSLRS